jgi:hypothetical protein
MIYKEMQRLLKPLSRKLQVRFALDCALDVRHMMSTEAVAVLEVVERWLKGKATEEEVRVAALAAYSAATTSAAKAAYYAASAAYSAANYAAKAAYYAASVVYTSYKDFASYTAHYAANAAYSAAENREEKMKEYHGNLVGMISNLSELEKVIYDLE